MLKMKSRENNYGICGKKAPFKDSNGDTLYTGDMVILIRREMNRNCGQRCIVEDENKIFVMGIESGCPNYEQEWEIYKEKSYMSAKVGDVIDSIEYYEQDEEIDKQEIEEYKTNYSERCIDVEVREKINEIIRVVNKIKGE